MTDYKKETKELVPFGKQLLEYLGVSKEEVAKIKYPFTFVYPTLKEENDYDSGVYLLHYILNFYLYDRKDKDKLASIDGTPKQIPFPIDRDKIKVFREEWKKKIGAEWCNWIGGIPQSKPDKKPEKPDKKPTKPELPKDDTKTVVKFTLKTYFTGSKCSNPNCTEDHHKLSEYTYFFSNY